MKVETKSALILLVTLALGALLGAFATGAAARQRSEQLARMGRPMGFVEHMRDVIRPRDQVQWDSLRPRVEATGRRNEAIRRQMHESLRAELDTMRAQLAPLLDDAQRERLADFARRPPPEPGRRPPGGPPGPPPGGPGWRPGGPPGNGPPPPGEGP